MRWRTEQELVVGRGQFTCGEKRCTEKENLKTWEVNFAYQEHGEKKNALIKLSKSLAPFQFQFLLLHSASAGCSRDFFFLRLSFPLFTSSDIAPANRRVGKRKTYMSCVCLCQSSQEPSANSLILFRLGE